MKPLTISLIQADLFWEDKARNLSFFEQTILTLPPATHIVVMPELFSTGFSMNAALAEEMDGPAMQWMRSVSCTTGKILTGSLMIREEGKIFNRLIWMMPNGVFYHYDKRHLFAFGKEDTVFAAGEKRLLVQVNGWTICPLICYDLRFPVWNRQQPKPLYDILMYVANWPEKRNHAWKTLLQARAIENQCYVVAVNRTGLDGNGMYHSGDSMFVYPQGEITETVSGKVAVITHVFEKLPLQETRAHFPFLKDRDSFMIL